ncbi:hypothetical protein OIU77_024157 [Salix suchowensis]|uniref:Uncharacterized protein n=1 Tax=Salix suchowensis TaxID=1278906 RepID=A0ABQ9BRQ9_9ROSI|nr:hypothetical protein OIU77_024157 [Salix suchowensis]
MSVNEEPLSSGYRRRSSSGMPTPCFLYMSILSDPEGCSFCILDIEKAPISELPSNEEAVGVITTEDVIKELLRGIWTSQCLALFTDPCSDPPYIDEMTVILTVEFPLPRHAILPESTEQCRNSRLLHIAEEILDGTDEYVKIHNRGSDQVSFLLFASVASTYEICEAME